MGSLNDGSRQGTIPKYLLNPKKIHYLNHNFLHILVEELAKSKQLLRILIKLLDPQITFYNSESTL